MSRAKLVVRTRRTSQEISTIHLDRGTMSCVTDFVQIRELPMNSSDVHLDLKGNPEKSLFFSALKIPSLHSSPFAFSVAICTVEHSRCCWPGIEMNGAKNDCPPYVYRGNNSRNVFKVPIEDRQLTTIVQPHGTH